MNVTFEKVEELFEMLKGESLPDGITMKNQPELNHEQAFSVIWFPQEHHGVRIKLLGVRWKQVGRG